MTVRNFHYQLQNTHQDALISNDIDLYILDAQKEDGSYWTPSELFEVTRQGVAKAICYLSIGEAEDYRRYWNPFAEYLGPENPDWKGNYRAKFWMSEWQDIVFKQLDGIMKMGFDGVYLDVVDVYRFWADRGQDRMAMRMLEFVEAIAKRAKERDTAFLIVPQNAPELLEYRAYASIVDGIGIENYVHDEDGEETADKYRRELDWYLRFIAGKPVLVTDYVPFNTASTLATIRDKGYVPLITSIDLDRNPDEVAR